jgi:hypothetical protein
LLVRIRREAGSIVSAVRTIAERTSPIEEIVGDINDDLVAAREALDAVVGREEPFKVPRQRVEVAVPAGKREEDRGGLRGAVRSFMGKARDGSSAARGGGR